MGLDIGTSRVTAVVGEVGPAGLSIVGVGSAVAEGVRKGVVHNADAAAASIEEALKEAELAAGVEIHSVIVDVGGDQVAGRNSHGVAAIRSAEVAEEDLARVIEAARAIPLPENLAVLHVLPQHYAIDDEVLRESPLGTPGARLEAHAHVVTVLGAATLAVEKACERAGVHVAGVILAPLAAAYAVLTPAEMEMGVALIDFGAATTDILVFRDGALRHTGVVPYGGNHVTSDIAAVLKTPFRQAEMLKCQHASLLDVASDPDESVEIPGAAPGRSRMIAKAKLGHVVESRVEEILGFVRDQLSRMGLLDSLTEGAVLTGGGAALPGLAELAERVLECPARVGVPRAGEDEAPATAGADSPGFAAATGLVRCGVAPFEDLAPTGEEVSAPTDGLADPFRRAWSAVKRMLFRRKS